MSLADRVTILAILAIYLPEIGRMICNLRRRNLARGRK